MVLCCHCHHVYYMCTCVLHVYYMCTCVLHVYYMCTCVLQNFCLLLSLCIYMWETSQLLLLSRRSSDNDLPEVEVCGDL